MADVLKRMRLYEHREADGHLLYVGSVPPESVDPTDTVQQVDAWIEATS